MITYETHIKPYAKDFVHIEVDDHSITKINDFVANIILQKKKEAHHLIDEQSHFKRYYTGTLGEVAMEIFLGVAGIVDWTIGSSEDYNVPDMKKIGVNAGIKTVNYGSFPVVFKKNFSSQIMMIRWKEKHVYICGLATPELLNKYQSDELILDRKLRERGTKTGFYGFEQLKKFATKEELVALLKM